MNIVLVDFDNNPVTAMWAEWFITGPQGAHFILYPEERHSNDDYKKAKLQLKYDHDVVSIVRGKYSEQQENIFAAAQSYLISDDLIEWKKSVSKNAVL